MTFKLNVKTNQEAFDKVVRHLAQQPDRCAIYDDCVYQREDGNRCAVGALIDATDEELLAFERDVLSTLSGTSVIALFDKGHLDIGSVAVDLLTRLQRVHDNDYRDNDESRFTHWQDLVTTAEDWALSTKVLDEVVVPA
jgi:hypothetical protein